MAARGNKVSARVAKRPQHVKRPSPATMDWEHRGWLRMALVDHYDRDAEFASALLRLSENARELSHQPSL
jgi:hypothetical protein